MVAYGFIVGYVTLWLGWSSLVRVAFGPHERPPTRLGPAGRIAAILVCALLPVGVLSLTEYCTRWFPPLVLAMLSLMTPALLVVFVAQRLGPLMGKRRDLAFDVPNGKNGDLSKRIRRDR